MITHLAARLFLIFLLAFVGTATLAANTPGVCPAKPGAQIVGSAKKKTGEFLYCEFYSIVDRTDLAQLSFINKHTDLKTQLDNRDAKLVTYTNAQGDAIAYKLLSYPKVKPVVNRGFYLYQPNMFQRDLRSGEERIAFLDDSKWIVKYKKSTADETRQAFGQPGEFTVDAGFYDYISDNLTAIVNKNAVFEFLSVPHLKTVSLRVKQKGCADKHQMTICFNVDLNNFVLRLFAGSLALSYDVETENLKRFEGVVNIRSNDQKTVKAVINYQHY